VERYVAVYARIGQLIAYVLLVITFGNCYTVSHENQDPDSCRFRNTPYICHLIVGSLVIYPIRRDTKSNFEQRDEIYQHATTCHLDTMSSLSLPTLRGGVPVTTRLNFAKRF
jgi:hypothetical protein